MKKGEESRANIMAAAQELFFQNGIPQTSVAQIAQRAGIAKGTFYHHFKSKEELVSGFVEQRIGEHLRALEALCGKAGAPYEQRFLDCLTYAAGFARYYDGLQRRAGVDDAEYERYLDRFVLRSAEIFEPFLKEGIERGFLHITHPREIYLIFAFGVRTLRRFFPESKTEQEIVESLLGAAEEMFHIDTGKLTLSALMYKGQEAGHAVSGGDRSMGKPLFCSADTEETLKMQQYFDTLPAYVQETLHQSGVSVSSKEELERCVENMTARR